jgi:hypothetical protein
MGIYYLRFVLASALPPPTSTEAPNSLRRMMAADDGLVLFELVLCICKG